MAEQNLLEMHLQKLAAYNHSLAALLASLSDTSIPSHYSPREEVEKWYNDLKLDNISTLYVYGIGCGDAYEYLEPWLRRLPSRTLFFLEDDLACLKHFLSTPKASALMDDVQVEIYDVSQVLQSRWALREITQDNMLRPASITALPEYLETKASNYRALRDLILFESSEQNILYRELIGYGVNFYRNFYPNILELSDAYEGRGLYHKFENIPAIICGAGPSLIKDIPILQKLTQRALIFAPSSALNVLTSHGIWPHFGVALDPTAETFHRQYMQRGFETPIFYQNRIYHETLSSIQGPKLFLPDNTFYAIEKWCLEQLEISSEAFSGGYSSVHTAILIAQRLGCKPLIFTGLDLSKSPTQHYASGVERHPLFPLAGTKPELGEPITVKDIHGNEVISYWPWIAEADWADHFHKKNPALNMINASNAGIGLFSVPNQSLSEAAQTWLIEEYDLEAMVHTAIQEAGRMTVQPEQIGCQLEILLESLENCLDLCKEIRQLLSDNNLTGLPALEEQLKQEVGYTYILSQMDDFYHKFSRKERRAISRLSDPEMRQEREILINNHMYEFLIQALEVNRTLIIDVLEKKPIREPEACPKMLASEIRTHPKQTKGKTDADERVVEKENCKFFRYASGALYSIQPHENGLREGSHLYYYPNGTVRSEINYSKGLLEGFTRLYSPSGRIKREIWFRAGQRHGMEVSWYENGQKYTEVEYEHNVPKQARCWDQHGRLVKDLVL